MAAKKGLGHVAIYYRVSTDKQDFDSQKQSVEQWLEQHPETPTSLKIFKDEGITGSTTKRPGYQLLLSECYKKAIDTIVCYRLDRFSRSASNAIQQILQLDELGVAFISVTQPVLNLGHENPFRRTMLAAFAEIAEIERETIVARVRSGLEAAKKRGVQLGPPRKLNTDLQEKIISARENGGKMQEIATQFGVSLGTIHKVIKQHQAASK